MRNKQKDSFECFLEKCLNLSSCHKQCSQWSADMEEDSINLPSAAQLPSRELEEWRVPQLSSTDTNYEREQKLINILKRIYIVLLTRPLNAYALNRYKKNQQSKPSAAALKEKREDTTMAKILFTQFKKKLLKREGCPVDMSLYFSVCDYRVNHRTLIDFQIPFSFVQRCDKKEPGLLQRFKDYIVSKKSEILKHGQAVYGKEPKRLQTYVKYLNRVYEAYEKGQTSEERINILYGKKSFHSMKKFQQILSKMV